MKVKQTIRQKRPFFGFIFIDSFLSVSISGLVKYSWRNVFVCSKCHVTIAITNTRADWRPHTNRFSCFVNADSDNSSVDCAIFPSFTKSKKDFIYRLRHQNMFIVYISSVCYRVLL